jgi:hypothetical protein
MTRIIMNKIADSVLYIIISSVYNIDKRNMKYDL